MSVKLSGGIGIGIGILNFSDVLKIKSVSTEYKYVHGINHRQLIEI